MYEQHVLPAGGVAIVEHDIDVHREQLLTSAGPQKASLGLPAEIIHRIFIFSSEIHIPHKIGFKNSSKGAPMCIILTRVCSLWRELAIGLPSLWSSLSYDLNYLPFYQTDGHSPREERWQGLHRITALFIERAGRHPLSLEFSNSYNTDIQSFNSTFNLLCQKSDQWEALSSDDFYKLYSLPAFSGRKGKFQNLRRLQCLDFVLDNEFERTDIASALREAMELPFDQLQVLTITTRFSHDLALSLISSCTRLKGLTFHLTDTGLRNIEAVCNLPQLQSLCVSVREWSSFTLVARSLVTPRLSSLELCSGLYEGSQGISEEDATFLFEFIERIQEHLSTLIIRETYLTETHVSRILKLLPNLQSLHLFEGRTHDSFSPNSPTFVGRLLFDATSTTPFLPRLESFKLTTKRLSLLKVLNLLTEVILSRRIASPALEFARLRSLELELEDVRDSPSEILKRLSQIMVLRNNGLQIMVWVGDRRVI